MKIQIIQLDPEDDHHSAREKLRWAKPSRVVLVWPGRGRILTRQLDLVLLQRESQQRGIQLGLITFDPLVTEVAADLGIPVFDSLEAIDQQSWTRPNRSAKGTSLRIEKNDRSVFVARDKARTEARTLPRWIRYVLFGLTGFVLLGVIGFSMPTTRITLDPPVVFLTKTIEVSFSSDARGPESESLTVKTASAVVSATVRVPTTGESFTADASAAGEVQMTNISTEVVDLPSGTRLRAFDSPAVTFETTISVTLPAGESVTVPIVAVDAGPNGNLEAGTNWALESELGLVVEIENQASISGGTVATRMAVSASDQTAALRDIQDELLASAYAEIEHSLTPDQILLPGSLRIVHTVASSQDHAVGEIADSLEVAGTLELEGFVVDRLLLLQALEFKLRNDLEAGQALVPESLSILKITPTGPRQVDSLPCSFEVQARAYEEIDRTTLAQQLRGIPRDEIDLAVQRYSSGLSVFRLSTWPAWLPNLPFFEFQITIAMPWEGTP